MKEAAERVIELTENDKTRFWAKVDKSAGPDACWLWTAAKRKTGYGLFYIRRAHGSHRIAWAMDKGPIPDGLCVCHRCDNPPCCNPAHLFLGTYADNNHDKEIKGRGNHASGNKNGARTKPERLSRGDAHYSRTHPERLSRGESHSRAKLTTAQVLEIRDLYAAGGITYCKLAALFGVSYANIGDIIHRRVWKHVGTNEVP